MVVGPWPTAALLASLGGALLFCGVSVGAYIVYFSQRQRRSDVSSTKTTADAPPTSSEAAQKMKTPEGYPELLSRQSLLLAACGVALFLMGAFCGNALGAHPAY